MDFGGWIDGSARIAIAQVYLGSGDEGRLAWSVTNIPDNPARAAQKMAERREGLKGKTLPYNYSQKICTRLPFPLSTSMCRSSIELVISPRVATSMPKSESFSVTPSGRAAIR